MNIVLKVLFIFLSFDLIINAIQVTENTNQEVQTVNQTEQNVKSIMNVNSKGPVLYPNSKENTGKKAKKKIKDSSESKESTLQRIKKNNPNNSNSAVKSPAPAPRRPSRPFSIATQPTSNNDSPVSETPARNQNPSENKHNDNSKSNQGQEKAVPDFVPSPEIQFPSYEQVNHQMNGNVDTFQPSVDLSFSGTAETPSISEQQSILFAQQQQMIAQRQKEEQLQQQIHQYVHKKQPLNTNVNSNIIYGKFNQQQKEQEEEEEDNNSQQNFVSWPDKGQSNENSMLYHNHAAQIKPQIKVVNQHYKIKRPERPETFTQFLHEIGVQADGSMKNFYDHHQHQNQQQHQHQYQLQHQQQYEIPSPSPTSSEHPYRFETVPKSASNWQDQSHYFDNGQQHGYDYTKNYETDVSYSSEDGHLTTTKYPNIEELKHEHVPIHHQIGDKKFLYWKKIAAVVASFIPLGLLVSALTPNVLIVNPNATVVAKSPFSPFTVVKPARNARLFDDDNINKFYKNNLSEILSLIKNNKIDSNCIERAICEIAFKSHQDNDKNQEINNMLLDELRKIYKKNNSTNKLSNINTDNLFNEASKGMNCNKYICGES